MIKRQFKHLKSQATKATNRLLRQEINLAVTGFSRAGKSTFITSIANQLLYANKYNNLPFWSVTEKGKFIAATIDELPDRKVRRFGYSQNIDSLKRGSWPKSTDSTSGLSLKIKYRTSNRLFSSLKENHTLQVNIYDYPGEWLLDLVMLKQNYESWSNYALELLQQDEEVYNQWLTKINSVALHRSNISELSSSFHECLRLLKSKNYLVSPGRFVLPADLEGAPILEFFPLCSEQIEDVDSLPEDVAKLLVERFDDFKENVVKPFFDSYFKNIDRQILLVDCMSLLRASKNESKVVAHSIEELSNIFCYGSSNFLTRLWSPKIDKVVFVATKADQVPTDQQFRLQSFVESLFYPTHNKLRFRETQVDFITLSSVKCTESVVAEVDGKTLHCIKGTLKESNETTVVFPGLLPESIDELAASNYDLPEYLPPKLNSDEIPHIRMGKLLEFVTGDLFL